MPIVNYKDNQQLINIYYEVVGQGEPIVFHHGNGNCVKDWYTLGYVDELSKHFKLILIDSRGYGKSSKPYEPAAYNLHSRAKDTIAVLDELKINKAHCLGGSVGASVCMMLARYYPERFKSYIFATPFFTQFNDEIRQALLKGTEQYLAKLEELLGSRIDNELIRQTLLANDAKALWAANSSEWFDYLDYVKYIKVPSMIYLGALEPSVDKLTQLANLLPNNQLYILPDINHAQVYWNGKLVSPLIKTFISNLKESQ